MIHSRQRIELFEDSDATRFHLHISCMLDCLTYAGVHTRTHTHATELPLQAVQCVPGGKPNVCAAECGSEIISEGVGGGVNETSYR